MALLASIAPATSSAQAAAPSGVIARPGELVRVRTAEWEYTGTLARIAGDTALVRFGADSALIPRASVLRAQVQRGTRRSATRIVLTTVLGAGAGMFLGGVAGTVLECGSDCNGAEYEGLVGALAGATLGTAVGAIGGGMWGARKRYPRWMTAVLPFD